MTCSRCVEIIAIPQKTLNLLEALVCIAVEMDDKLAIRQLVFCCWTTSPL